MLRTIIIFNSIAFSVALCSCEQDNSEMDKKLAFEESSTVTDIGGHNFIAEDQSRLEQVIDDIRYTTRAVSALDYLSHIGESPLENDHEALKSESVFIMELSTNNGKSIKKSKELTLNDDELMKYLIGDIIKDFTVTQNEETYFANGTGFENSFGSDDKIRIMFYMKGIDLSKEYKVIFYDKILGKGMIRFSYMNSHLLSLR